MEATVVLAIATFILAFFAAGSAGAAAWTAWETKRLRKDSARPLLVRVGGREGVARLAELPGLDNEKGGFMCIILG